MLNIGNYNTLKVIKMRDFGAFLDGGDGREILLPTRYVPDSLKPGDDIEVFIYHDNEGRLDLQFVPVLDRKDITDLGVLASRQHQVFGHFSGTVILDNGQKVKIQNKLGFAEKVFNKW